METSSIDMSIGGALSVMNDTELMGQVTNIFLLATEVKLNVSMSSYVHEDDTGTLDLSVNGEALVIRGSARILEDAKDLFTYAVSKGLASSMSSSFYSDDEPAEPILPTEKDNIVLSNPSKMTREYSIKTAQISPDLRNPDPRLPDPDRENVSRT